LNFKGLSVDFGTTKSGVNVVYMQYIESLFFQIKVSIIKQCVSLDIAVGIATSYGLDDRGGSEFESRWDQEFSLLQVV
jgi:hypothetical protein